MFGDMTRTLAYYKQTLENYIKYMHILFNIRDADSDFFIFRELENIIE